MEEKQESKFIQKSKTLIQKLRENNLDFNSLFILECFYYENDREFLNVYTIPSLKDLNLSISLQNLKKLEYIVEDPEDASKLVISVKGKNLIEDLLNPPVQISENMSARGIMIDLGKTEEDMFEEWWKTYPKSTAWTSDDGIAFLGSRNPKNLRKPEAKKRYLKLLNQGFKHEDLMSALLYEIKLKKLDSVKKNTNQMDFFKGMEAYLNQETYRPYLEMHKENPDFIKGEEKIRSKKRHVHDI